MLDRAEAAIKQAIEDALARTVKQVESHPGHWGAATIKHMVANAPCVFIGFSAGSYQNNGGDQLKAQWHVYLVGQALNGQNSRSIGVYQMLQRLLPALHELDINEADALRFERVKNLFSFAEAKKGVSCYEMVFSVPMHWPDLQNESDLDDWLRYNADHIDQDDPNHIMATDTVEITQE